MAVNAEQICSACWASNQYMNGSMDGWSYRSIQTSEKKRAARQLTIVIVRGRVFKSCWKLLITAQWSPCLRHRTTAVAHCWIRIQECFKGTQVQEKKDVQQEVGFLIRQSVSLLVFSLHCSTVSTRAQLRIRGSRTML